MARILVVEDEEAIRNLIRMTLEIEKYQVLEAEDGEEGLAVFQQEMEQEQGIDLVLLDIMLPKMDGHQVLQKIKDRLVPVIFLTAKIAVSDRVYGLKLGADDYITKPFEPMELLARVETALARKERYAAMEAPESEEQEEVLTYGDITLMPKEHAVCLKGEPLSLTVKEYDLLELFMRNPGTVYSRQQLLDEVWDYDYYGGTRTVDMHVKQLRQKLDLKQQLETVYKVGYKLHAIE